MVHAEDLDLVFVTKMVQLQLFAIQLIQLMLSFQKRKL